MYQEGKPEEECVLWKVQLALVQFLTLEWVKCPAREEGKVTVA